MNDDACTTKMIVRMHISERLCKLCRSDNILSLEGLCNNDENPVKGYPGDTGGSCAICGNYTSEWGGSKLGTDRPIEHLKKVQEKIVIARRKYEKRTEELIKKIREAKKNGESHIKIS